MTFLVNPHRFGGGGGGVSDPSAIFSTDLVAWYKLGTGVYDAVVGGSLLTAGSTDLTEVGRWEDASGNGFHATRASAIGVGHLRWRTTITDRSQPSIDCTDTSAYLNIPNGVGTALSGAGLGAIFMSIKASSDNGSSACWDFSASDAESLYAWSDSHIYEAWGTTVRKDTGIPAISISASHRRYVVVSKSADYKTYLNNTQHFTTGTNTVDFRTSNIRYFVSQGLSRASAFQVSEIVIVKVQPSSGQRDDMDTYLTT